MLATIHPGASYHHETLDGERYKGFFAKRIRPEDIDPLHLDGVTTIFVPCRTNPLRLVKHWRLFADFLSHGCVLVAMGESYQDEWIPGVSFIPIKTNYWWWLKKANSLEISISNPDHPLMNGIEKPDITWHLHGWYGLPNGADPLIVDKSGKTILYEDQKSFGGHLIVTSLDPCFHHGSYFMPATTLFLDKFIPNLAAFTKSLLEKGISYKRT